MSRFLFKAMSRIDARLAELGVVLPAAPAPAANYVPFTVSQTTPGLIHIAGQLPKINDKLVVGKLGDKLSVADGKEAAKACVLSLLAQAKAAAGDLDTVRFLKLNVFVNSAAEFTEQPAVANGASDFLVQLFGDQGRHARSAVGVAQLPFNCAVEIDAVIEKFR